MRGRSKVGLAFAVLLSSGGLWLQHAPPTPPIAHLAGEIVPQIGHRGAIFAFAITPDGKTAASLGETIKVWDTDSGALQRTIPLPFSTNQGGLLRFSPDGRSLAVLINLHTSTSLFIYNTQSGALSQRMAGEQWLRDVTFSADGARLCTVDWQNRSSIRDVASGQLLQSYAAPRMATPGNCLALSKALSKSGAPELLFISKGKEQGLMLCDVAAVGRPVVATARTNIVQNAVLQTSPQSASRDATLQRAISQKSFERVDQRKKLANDQSKPNSKTRQFSCISPTAWDQSADGRLLVVAGFNSASRSYGLLSLWDADNARLLRRFQAFKSPYAEAIMDVSLSPDGRWLAVIGANLTVSRRPVVKLWDTATGRPCGRWALPPSAPDHIQCRALNVRDNGDIVVAGLRGDQQIFLWSVKNARWSDGPDSLVDNWQHLEWSPDGTMLAANSELDETPGYMWGGGITRLYSGRAGNTGFHASTIRLWDLQAAELRRGFWGPIVPPRNTGATGAAALQKGGLASMLGVCAFSPDGQLLAVDEAGAIVLRDVATGAAVRTLAPLPANWSNVGDWEKLIWSPQGQTLLAVTSSQPTSYSAPPPATLTLWDTATGRLKAILVNQSQMIEASFTADGSAVIALVDGRTRAWESNLGTVLKLPSSKKGSKRKATVPFSYHLFYDPRRGILRRRIARPRVRRAPAGGEVELVPPVLSRQGWTFRAVRKGRETAIEIRDVLSGRSMRHVLPSPYNCQAFEPRDLILSPDGSALGINQANNVLTVWDLTNWQVRGQILLSASSIPLAGDNEGDVIYDASLLFRNPSIAIAPGGRRVAVSDIDGAIRLWNVGGDDNFVTLQILPSHRPRQGSQEWAIFAPNGFCVASPQASRDLRRLAGDRLLPFSP